jgi:predicted transcriptional regulator of viral defense system
MASYRDAADRLRSIARVQSGYFTARQARNAGYSYRAQHYQTSVGEWERAARGIYRMAAFPMQSREDLVVLTLLSHNRAGQPQAVASHDTALSIHELSDIDPEHVHLTVPPGFRKQVPRGVILHSARLQPHDWEEREGYRVTTPIRTLLDVASSPLSQEFLDAAVRDAVNVGMVRPRDLLAADVPSNAMKRLLAAVDAIQTGPHA